MCFLEVEEEKRETHVHILNIAVAINLFVAMIKTIILLPSIIILCDLFTCIGMLALSVNIWKPLVTVRDALSQDRLFTFFLICFN